MSRREATGLTVERVYLDRIEDGQAVLVTEDRQHERTIPATQLPRGAREGEWLQAASSEDEAGAVHYVRDRAETRKRKQRIQSLMDELS